MRNQPSSCNVTFLLGLTAVAVALAATGCKDREHDRAECAPAQASSSPAVAPAAAPSGPVVAAVSEPAPQVAAAPAPAAPRDAKVSPSQPRPRPTGDGKALAVKKIVIGTGVEKSARAPVGVAESFKQGEFEKLYAFVELENKGEEAEVVVSFDPPSDQPDKGNVRLAVGTSPRWRTWATSRGIDERGTWTAVVSTADGRELARESFEVL